MIEDSLRHYPGCAWLCGHSSDPLGYPCVCEVPQISKGWRHQRQGYPTCAACRAPVVPVEDQIARSATA